MFILLKVQNSFNYNQKNKNSFYYIEDKKIILIKYTNIFNSKIYKIFFF